MLAKEPNPNLKLMHYPFKFPSYVYSFINWEKNQADKSIGAWGPEKQWFNKMEKEENFFLLGSNFQVKSVLVQ